MIQYNTIAVISDQICGDREKEEKKKKKKKVNGFDTIPEERNLFRYFLVGRCCILVAAASSPSQSPYHDFCCSSFQ